MNLAIKELSSTENIFRLQEEMAGLPQELRCEPPVQHHFAPGVYAREMLIPKDTLIVGKIHIHSHLNIIVGDVSVATFEGTTRYCGHTTITSPAGVKRVVYAHTDTVWTTVHLTDKTNLEDIEAEIIAESYDDFLKLPEVAQ